MPNQQGWSVASRAGGAGRRAEEAVLANSDELHGPPAVEAGDGSAVVLRGRLEVFALADVLALLARSGVTGTLRVVGGGEGAAMHLRGGDVYFGLSAIGGDALGERLVRAGLVTRTQLSWALDLQQQERGKRLGDVLVEARILQRDVLEPFVEEQVEDVLSGLLRRDAGTFTFEPAAVEPEQVGRTLTVADLVEEARRRAAREQAVRGQVVWVMEPARDEEAPAEEPPAEEAPAEKAPPAPPPRPARPAAPATVEEAVEHGGAPAVSRERLLRLIEGVKRL